MDVFFHPLSSAPGGSRKLDKTKGAEEVPAKTHSAKQPLLPDAGHDPYGADAYQDLGAEASVHLQIENVDPLSPPEAEQVELLRAAMKTAPEFEPGRREEAVYLLTHEYLQAVQNYDAQNINLPDTARAMALGDALYAQPLTDASGQSLSFQNVVDLAEQSPELRHGLDAMLHEPTLEKWLAVQGLLKG